MKPGMATLKAGDVSSFRHGLYGRKDTALALEILHAHRFRNLREMYASQSSSVTYLPDVVTYAGSEKVYREFGVPDDAWVGFEVRCMKAHATNETAETLPDKGRRERHQAVAKRRKR